MTEEKLKKIKRIVALAKTRKYNYADIGSMIGGVSRQRVHQYIMEARAIGYKVDAPRRIVSDAEDIAIHRLYVKDQMTMKAIAEKLKISVFCVRQSLRRTNTPTRQRGVW